MTAAKIRLALPLKRVFVVKMRVTAGRRRAPKPFDKQPKVQSAQGRGGANFQAAKSWLSERFSLLKVWIFFLYIYLKAVRSVFTQQRGGIESSQLTWFISGGVSPFINSSILILIWLIYFFQKKTLNRWRWVEATSSLLTALSQDFGLNL